MGEDPEANLARSLELAAESVSAGAQLVVLPELHRNRYFCQTEDPTYFALAETMDGPTATAVGDFARRRRVVVVASIFERRGAGVFHNTALVFDADGRRAGIYRKMHIPDDPQYFEKFYFAPGDQGFTPVDTAVGRLGVLICWDQWFPEAARVMALADADILVYPTAIGGIPSEPADERARQLDAWVTVQRGHAIANGCAVVAVNRCGFEPRTVQSTADDGIHFWGNSFVAGPQGELLARLDEREQAAVVALDLTRGKEVRRLWPFFRDRRVDAYGDLLRRAKKP
jgi:N-carbamoylputrescine amidase